MQRVWLESYLQCWNATEAARIAGYKHPNVQGPRLANAAKMQAAISARVEQAAMGANEVLARLAQHARGSMLDFLRFPDAAEREQGMARLATAVREAIKNGEYEIDLDEFDLTKFLSVPTLDLDLARERGQLGLIRDYSWEHEARTTPDGDTINNYKHKIKLYDAQAALVQLGRYHGLFTDKVDHNLSGEVAVKGYMHVSPDDWDETTEAETN